jgi:hypothetical protein
MHRWDEDFQKKPAYDAILKAYSGASSSSPPSASSAANNSSSTTTTSESSTISNIATTVSIAPSTGLPDRSTMESLPSATDVVLEATTDEAECEVVYLY